MICAKPVALSHTFRYQKQAGDLTTLLILRLQNPSDYAYGGNPFGGEAPDLNFCLSCSEQGQET